MAEVSKYSQAFIYSEEDPDQVFETPWGQVSVWDSGHAFIQRRDGAGHVREFYDMEGNLRKVKTLLPSGECQIIGYHPLTNSDVHNGLKWGLEHFRREGLSDRYWKESSEEDHPQP